MVILIIISIILFSYSVYISIRSYNLILQNEASEEEFELLVDRITELRDRIVEMEIRMKEIDLRGAFEADDEVGFVYKDIRQMVADLNKLIESVYEF
jgi:hypothetical protein